MVTATVRAPLALFVLLFVGCQRDEPPSRAPGTSMEPDIHPPGSNVSLVVRFVSPDAIPLGPRSAQLFLEMLAKPAIHTRISSMPALPMGTFTVGEADYLWHGNGVTRGSGEEERMWHGPFTQRLISDFLASPHKTREAVIAVLDAIERDTTVASTPVQGPGAYPGGGDALHPIPESQFEVFNPEAKAK